MTPEDIYLLARLALLEEMEQKLIDEWEALQEHGCSCPTGHPPCHYCTEGGSLSVEEYVALGLGEYTDET